MSRDVILPRKRKPQFILLGVCVLSFIASFWWAAKLPFSNEVSMGLWFIHLLAIGVGLMARAVWYKGFVSRDYAHARQFLEVTLDEVNLCKPLDCTIYRLERNDRQPGQPSNVYTWWEWHVEFHNDDDHVWFLMARPTPQRLAA